MRLINGVSFIAFMISEDIFCIFGGRENAILSQVFGQAIASFGKSNQRRQHQNSQ